MFRKLRRRIIVFIMGISGVILVGLFTALCVINYVQIADSGYSILKMIATDSLYQWTEEPEITDDEDSKHVLKDGAIKVKAWYDGLDQLKFKVEDKYFFYIQREALTEIINIAILSDTQQGVIREYKVRYYKITDASGVSTIAFSKCAREIDYMRRLITFSVLIVVLGLGIVFVVSIYISKMFVKPAEDAYRQQQQFIADASHELKTPLTVILANNKILMNSDVDNEAHFWIASTQSEAETMKQLLDRMLYLAKSDANMLVMQMEELNFSVIVMSCVLSFEAIAFEKGITITEKIESDLKINADATEIKNLLGILLDNAIKYSHENTDIKVSLTRQRGNVELIIKNKGETIPAENLSHIFERFFRVDESHSKKISGFGLGLPIAKKIVEKTGGNISCISESGNTSLIVVFPYFDKN